MCEIRCGEWRSVFECESQRKSFARFFFGSREREFGAISLIQLGVLVTWRGTCFILYNKRKLYLLFTGPILKLLNI